MNSKISLLRYFFFLVVTLIAFQYVSEEEGFVVFNSVEALSLFVMIAVVGLMVEILVFTIKRVIYFTATEEKRKIIDEVESVSFKQKWLTPIIKKIVGSKPIKKEDDIIFKHDYDGIKELDNSLPPWWIYLFYATIIFAAIYLVRFEILGGFTQAEEYEEEIVMAEKAIEAYEKTAKDLVDVNTVELLTESGDLAKGKQIFQTSCVACHMADGGGGIGPNLTDEYWISGGGIKNVFHTVSEGGRAGKGMIAWKQSLKPVAIAQVASYLLSLQGTTPANPKEPQGDLWQEE